MKKDLNIGKIESRFQELIGLDQNHVPDPQQTVKGTLLSTLLSAPSSKTGSTPSQPSQILHTNKKTSNDNDQLIFTKSDICRQVAKLKPYLRHFGQKQTSVELEDRNNKRIADQEQNCLSQLVIYLNKELCEQLRGPQEDQGQNMRRQNREKEGWVYEVFYRHSFSDINQELGQSVFKNGYAVLTDKLQLFPNLTFEQNLLKININEVKRVKYFQQREYQVIDIRFKQGNLHVAFLNQAQMKLFDRMFFLLKNMARTSSTRLFQNQLLKNIYSEY